MITTADAMRVMLTVQACHQRTAPRMDDEDVALATARTWAKLFNVHNLTVAHLEEAVIQRAAAGERDAPEPGEIITMARKIRRDLDAETGPTPEYEALCESKARDDADELAALREQRALAPRVERPQLAALVAGVAGRKGIS